MFQSFKQSTTISHVANALPSMSHCVLKSLFNVTTLTFKRAAQTTKHKQTIRKSTYIGVIVDVVETAHLLISHRHDTIPQQIMAVAINFGMNYAIEHLYTLACGQSNFFELDHLMRQFVLKFSYDYPADHTIMKSAFMQSDIPYVRPQSCHSHPEQAALRSTASAFASSLALQTSCPSYEIQRSRSDERAGRAGCRINYWGKDLIANETPFAHDPRNLHIFIDVDYYVDMPTFLSEHFQPTFLYSLQPSATSRDVPGGYAYCFNADQSITYRVHGSGEFVHHIWNWSVDSVGIYITNAFGLPKSYTVYCIERRTVSLDRDYVMLIPTKQWRGLPSVMATLLFPSNNLNILEPVSGNFVRLMTQDKHGLQTHTGITGKFINSTLPTHVDEYLASICRTSKHDLLLSSVMNVNEQQRVAAAISQEYHLSKSGHKPPVICPTSLAAYHYTFDQNGNSEGYRPVLSSFCKPFIQGAWVPIADPPTEQHAINERIIKVAPQPLHYDGKLIQLMHEFSELLIPSQYMHKTVPTSEEEVYIRQMRPTQRRILDMANYTGSTGRTSSFMKAEPYQGPKPARIISTINPSDKLAYSQVMYAFSDDVLKRQPWYAFGKTPREIEQRVVEICERAEQYITNSDFSKFDGHGSNTMRVFERILLLRAFKVEYHTAVSDLHFKQYGMRGYSKLGAKYDTNFTRASGSPETSAFNSLTNCFVSYVTLRTTLKGSYGHNPSSAWELLGIFGGDDGLNADVNIPLYLKSAQRIGQVVEAEPVAKGQLGVKFLSRFYGPEVWYGDPNNCSDIKRIMSKIHLSQTLPPAITPAIKLHEKCRCLIMCDPHTPVLGPLCQRVCDLGNANVHGINYHTKYVDSVRMTLHTWNSQYATNVQYTNRDAEWMHTVLERDLEGIDEIKFITWLAAAPTIDHIIQNAYLLTDIQPAKISEPVVVNGDLQFPPKTLNAQQMVVENPNSTGPTGSQAAGPPDMATQRQRIMRWVPKTSDGRLFADVTFGSGNTQPNRKQNPVTTSSRRYVPVTTVKPETHFEKVRREKIANGTWQETPPVKNK